MYRDSIDINLSGGRAVGVIFPHNPTFAEIFNATPLYYYGSTIVLEEIFTIHSTIIDDTLVDVDKRWFNSRYYIGTYDSDSLIISGLDLENSGRILAYDQKIKRYSNYTIVANPNRRRSIAFGSAINQCNFELQTVQIDFQGGQISASQPIKNNGLFNVLDYKEPCNLADTEYNSFFKNPGFYCYEGAYILSCERQISVINDIYVDDPAWTPVQCSLGEPDCDREFQTFFENARASSGGEFNHYELSASACLYYETPLLKTFTCSDGQTRDYYFCGGAN